MSETRRRYGLTRSHPGIPLDTRLAVRGFAAWLRERPTVQDDVIVVNTRAEVVQVGEVQAFGCFQWQDEVPPSRIYVWIYIAGLMPEVCESEGLTRDEGIDCLLTTLAHEFAHYEQWRRGAAPDEDDADHRACDLVNAYYAERGIPRTVAYPSPTHQEPSDEQ